MLNSKQCKSQILRKTEGNNYGAVVTTKLKNGKLMQERKKIGHAETRQEY